MRMHSEKRTIGSRTAVALLPVLTFAAGCGGEDGRFGPIPAPTPSEVALLVFEYPNDVMVVGEEMTNRLLAFDANGSALNLSNPQWADEIQFETNMGVAIDVEPDMSDPSKVVITAKQEAIGVQAYGRINNALAVADLETTIKPSCTHDYLSAAAFDHAGQPQLCLNLETSVWLGDVIHSLSDKVLWADQAQCHDHSTIQWVSGGIITRDEAQRQHDGLTASARYEFTMVPESVDLQGDTYLTIVAKLADRIPLMPTTFIDYAFVADLDGATTNNYIPDANAQDHWAQDGDYVAALNFIPATGTWGFLSIDTSTQGGVPQAPRLSSRDGFGVIGESEFQLTFRWDGPASGPDYRVTAYWEDTVQNWCGGYTSPVGMLKAMSYGM